MKIKTSELKFGALDWCIAQIEGIKVELTPPNYGDGTSLVFISGRDDLYRPSTDWSQGGPMIEQFSVSVGKMTNCPPGPRQWDAFIDTKFCETATYSNFGPTPLIAACRAIVAAKLGDEVDVPEGLV